MTIAAIIFIVALAAAHIVSDVYGVAPGRQVRWLFFPFVFLIYAITLSLVDIRNCAACHKREAQIDIWFGGVPVWKRVLRFIMSFLPRN